MWTDKTFNPWLGRVFTGLPGLALVASGAMKLTGNPEIVKMLTEKFGFRADHLPVIAVIELACATLYLIPQTAALGAVLLTGYLGGAVVTHLRVGDPVVAPVLLGVLLWLGLWFRDKRVRGLLPVRGPQA